MFFRNLRISLVGAILILDLLVLSPRAFATLRLYPTRLFFTPEEKSSSVTVRNEGEKAATFRAVLKFYQMSDEGKMTEIVDESADHAAIRKMVKFSPREFRLDANKEQLIRVLSKLPVSPSANEYRVHLHVSTFDDKDARVVSKETDVAAQVSTELKVHFGVAVPLVMRIGTLKQSLSVEASAVSKGSDGKKFVRIKVANSGEGSVFGSLKVFSDESKTKVLTELGGIAIYGKQRSMELPLEATAEHGFVEFSNDLDESVTSARF